MRAFDKWIPGEGGCQISTYSTASHGYAQIGWYDDDGRRYGTLCHRAVWTLVNGQIPDGMTIDHVCKNRRCVNIDHLRMLSNFENARRTAGRDWPVGECINGHSNEHLTFEGGKWRCRLCRRQWQRQYRAKNRDRYNQRQRERRARKRLENATA